MRYSEYKRMQDLKVMRYIAQSAGIDEETGMINDMYKYFSFKYFNSILPVLKLVGLPTTQK